MPSAQEDDGWRAAALVLAGIEPAVTSAMRAASKIELPSSSCEVVEDREGGMTLRGKQIRCASTSKFCGRGSLLE